MRNHVARGVRFERVPIAGSSSFVVRHTRAAQYRFHWHYHPEVELVLVARGRGRRFVGDSIETFEAGDLCLLGANLPHTRHSEPRPGGVHSIMVQFLPQAWGETFLGLPEMRPIQRLLRQARRGLRVTGPTQERVSELVRSIARQSRDSITAFPMLLEALGLLAVSTELTPLATADFRPEPGQPAGRRLVKVLRAINQGNEHSQRAMAEMVGLSPQSFSRFFKRQVGKTYVQYVNEWRISRVCRSLLETDQDILSIAYEAGFRNLSYFNRRFRQAKGMTPRQFRRLGRDGD